MSERPIADRLQEVASQIYAKDLKAHTCIVRPASGRCVMCGADYPEVREAFGVDREPRMALADCKPGEGLPVPTERPFAPRVIPVPPKLGGG